MTESAHSAVDGGRSDDAQRAALAWLDAHEADVIEFCKTFVRHPSVLTDECEVQERLVEPFLRECRYTTVERASFDPTKERPNLMAVWSGRGAGRSLLFNGHCDVVPVYEHELKHRWRTDPFDPVVSDGVLIGRGAVDMKAGITAYLWAVRALQETGVRLAGDVVATVVVGEESGQPQFGCLPTMAQQIEARGKPDLTIVAEPTHAEIHAASGGFFGFEVAIQGREVHVSARNLVKWPQRYGIPQGDEVGVDALDYLRELLDRLERMDRRWARIHRDPLLGGGGFPVPIDQQGVAPFFVSVGRVEAGDWAGSVPGHARLEGGVIYPGWLDGDDIKAELRAEIDALGLNDPWLRAHPPDVQIATSYDVPPFAIPLDHPACAALSSSYAAATAKQPVLSGFKGVHDGCYMRHEFGVDVVTMGPGDLKLAHSANEAVPVDELLDCARTFACMAIEWCGLSAEQEER